jgi:hypothetical protein
VLGSVWARDDDGRVVREGARVVVGFRVVAVVGAAVEELVVAEVIVDDVVAGWAARPFP